MIIILLTFLIHKLNNYSTIFIAHVVYTGGDQPSIKLQPYYRFINSTNIMPTKPFYLKLQYHRCSQTTDLYKHTLQIWSLGIQLMHPRSNTPKHTHTHNKTLHSHWHTFPEAKPVDRSHRANPLSEQWFPNARKPQNPLRSENNK